MSESKKGSSLAFAYTNKRKGSKSATPVHKPKDEAAAPIAVSKDESTEAESPKQRPKMVPLKRPGMTKGASFTSKTREELDEEERQKYADGGMVSKPLSATWEEEDHKGYHQLDAGGGDDEDESTVMAAEGGMIGDDEMEEEHHASIADAIMARRKYAQGGMVDLEENEEESPADPSEYDERNHAAALKEHYGDDLDSLDDMDEDFDDQNEKAAENKEDRVSAIRRKNKK